MRMIAIVTAEGEIEPNQPFYETTHGGLKSMINIAGKPMVQWMLDALGRSGSITRVIVVGLPPETDLICNHPLTLLPNTGNMLNNIRAGAIEGQRLAPNETHAIVATSDIPALRFETVDWLACQCLDLDQDIYYTLIERSAMEDQFPGVKRDYIHLKDMQVCGGYMHCLRLQAAVDESPLWKRLSDSRKGPFRQASILGYDAMLFMMLRRLSLKAAETAICKRLGVQGKGVLCPYPEAGMNVERPAQLEIMREYLARRPA